MDKLILTDIDGTLLNWDYHFDKFMIEKKYRMLENAQFEYSVAKRYGIPHLQAIELITEFNRSPRIEQQRPVADSVEYVGKLADLGFRFVAITAMGDFPESKRYREGGLLRYFGDVFDDIIYLPINAKKTAALEPWADSGLFWIEDHMVHAEAGYELGLRSVVINRPYVEKYSSHLFPKVSSTSPWLEIFNLVSDQYNI